MKVENKTKKDLVNELAGAREQIAALRLVATQHQEDLNAIFDVIASVSSDKFFDSLVRNLAQALQVRDSFITELTDKKDTVRTLAYWSNDGLLENFEYKIADAPCEAVLQGQTRHYPEKLQTLFPKDKDLVKLQAESYLGTPLTDA